MSITFAPKKGGGTVNLPRHIVPTANGKPQAKEHLAYISAAEAHMLKMMTDGKANKTQFGPQSFTDPSQAQGNTLKSTPTRTTSQSRAGESNGYVNTAPQSSFTGSYVSAAPTSYSSRDNSLTPSTASLLQKFGSSAPVASDASAGKQSPLQQALFQAASVPQLSPLGNTGWQVGQGVVSGSKMFPDRNTMTVDNAGSQVQPQTPITPYSTPGVVPAPQLPNANAMQGGLGSVAYGRGESNPAWGDAGISQLVNAGTMYGDNQEAMLEALASRPTSPNEYADGGGIYGKGPAPASDNETTDTGPNSPYATKYKQVGDSNANSFPVQATNVAKKTGIGKLLFGAGSLLDQATGGMYGNSLLGDGASTAQADPSFHGGYNQAQAAAKAQQQLIAQGVPPAQAAAIVKAKAPPGKVPWYYPQYTQSWANLPSGLLGGYIG